MVTRKPLVFEWTDYIERMDDFRERDPVEMGFAWATLQFNQREIAKLKRLRPFYGDKVNIRVEFLRGRLREANEEEEER